METKRVVKAFQVLKDGRSGLSLRGEVQARHALALEGIEKVGWASSEVHRCPFPNASLQTRRANFSAPGFPASSG